MSELTGRTALITGSSRGIGAAIAKTYAEAGMRVAINYRSDEENAQNTFNSLPGDGHCLLRADVSDPLQVRDLVLRSIDHFGRLNVLVNNAGIYEYQPFYTSDYSDWLAAWQRTLDNNLLSAVNAIHSVLPHMRASGGGKIIQVASRAAFRGETEAPAYAVSKAGMVNLTRCMARSLSADNILAYTIAPGWVETAMSREGVETMRDEIIGQIPVGRIASVGDVAGVALFLASDAANYLTGITIDVNGASYLH